MPPVVVPSNVCRRLKLTNSAPQKVIVKLSKRKVVYRVLKAKLILKNTVLTGTRIPLGCRILVNLRWDSQGESGTKSFSPESGKLMETQE